MRAAWPRGPVQSRVANHELAPNRTTGLSVQSDAGLDRRHGGLEAGDPAAAVVPTVTATITTPATTQTRLRTAALAIPTFKDSIAPG
jgi:hypothetical protein